MRERLADVEQKNEFARITPAYAGKTRYNRFHRLGE